MLPSPDTLTFACSACGAQLSVPISMAGVTGPCPTCRQQITAPLSQPGPAASPFVQPAAAAAPAQPAAAPPAGPPATLPPVPQAPPTNLPPMGAPVGLPQTPPAQSAPIPGADASPAAAQPPVDGPPATPVSSGFPTPGPGDSISAANPGIPAVSGTSLPAQEGAPPLAKQPTLLPKEDADHQTRHRRRTGRSSKKDTKSVRSTVLYGTLAIGALVTGGVLATPKILDLLDQSKAGVPETHHQANQAVPISPSSANQNSVSAHAREEALPLGPADGQLVNNSQPLLVEPNPQDIDPAPPPEILTNSTPLPETAAPDSTSDESLLDQPRQFLEEYLTAPNWNDLLPHSLGGDKLAERMETYYQGNPYQPERIQEITFQHKQPLPNSKHQFYLFKVITDSNPASFPMTVEETSDGYRTDWYSYVQFKDTHLQKFLENPQVGPDGKGETKTFNVILRRAHDFTGEVPDPENKWC